MEQPPLSSLEEQRRQTNEAHDNDNGYDYNYNYDDENDENDEEHAELLASVHNEKRNSNTDEMSRPSVSSLSRFNLVFLGRLMMAVALLLMGGNMVGVMWPPTMVSLESKLPAVRNSTARPSGNPTNPPTTKSPSSPPPTSSPTGLPTNMPSSPPQTSINIPTSPPTKSPSSSPPTSSPTAPPRWQLHHTTTVHNQPIDVWQDTQDPTHFYRDCGSYPNQIVYEMNYRAGIADRLRLLQLLAELGAYMCAKLYLPPPSVMFSPHHNDGNTSVDTSLTWSDFYTFATWYHPDDDADADDGNNNGMWMTMHPLPAPNKDGITKVHSLKTEATGDWTNWDKVMHMLTTNTNTTNDTTAWRWTFSCEFWICLDAVVLWSFTYLQNQEQNPAYLPFTNGNLYSNQQVAPTVQRAAQVLAERLLQDDMLLSLPQHPPNNDDIVILGSWHIRRGDSVSGCDTSLERLQTYVNCSFANVTANQQVVVLFFSDEENPDYRAGIPQLFQAWDNIHVVDLDRWMERQFLSSLEEEEEDTFEWPATYHNNFHFILLLYNLLELLPRRFELVHRRTVICEACATNMPLQSAHPHVEPQNPISTLKNFYH